jgi:hypothetical protein
MSFCSTNCEYWEEFSCCLRSLLIPPRMLVTGSAQAIKVTAPLRATYPRSIGRINLTRGWPAPGPASNAGGDLAPSSGTWPNAVPYAPAISVIATRFEMPICLINNSESDFALNNRPRQRATCPSWRAQAYQPVDERKIGLRTRVGSAQVGTAVVGAITLAPKPGTPERCGDNGLSVRYVAALQRPLRDRSHHNRVTDPRALFRLSL